MKRSSIFVLLFLVISLATFAQNRIIRGTVSSINGDKLEKVKVIAVESKTHSFSDENGNYEISVLPSETQLKFTLSGMINVLMPLDDNNEVNAKMVTKDSDDIFDISLEDLMNLEITIASKHSEKPSDAPGVISVVSNDEINRFGAKTVSDLLERVVGTYSLGNHLIKSVLSIRGDQTTETSSHVLVLINGRPTRERVWGGTDSDIYQAFPINTIDHIEVVRGPGSVLYGTNAYTGVINIITKKEENTYIQAEGSGFIEGGYSAGISGNIAKGDFQAFGGFNYLNTPSYDIDDYSTFDPRTNSLNTLPFAVKDTSIGVFIGANYKGVSAMFGYSRWDNSSEANFMYQRYFGDLGYEMNISDKWKINFNSTFTLFEQDATTDRKSSEILGEITNHFQFNDKLNLIVGGSYIYIDGNETMGTDVISSSMDTTENSYIIYSQLQYQLLNNLKLITGAQYNKVENLDGNIVPRFGAIYYPIEKINVKALYSRAYRAPSLDEKYVSDPQVRGNQSLLPEKVSSLDIGITWLGEHLQSSLTYYYNEQSDLISKGTVEGQNFSSFQNIDKLTIQGLELENKYYLNKNLLFILNSSYQTSKQDGIDNITPIPQLMIKSGVSYISDNGILLSAFNIYNGDYASDNIFKTVAINKAYASHNLLNLNANFDINKILNLNIKPQIDLSIQGENLLNVEVWNPNWVDDPESNNAYNIVYGPHAGRMTAVGLKAKF
jgi:outer membrane receptor protein involved in Fe transport